MTPTPAAPPPLAQLTFYPDTILVTKFTKRGTTTHPVHPQDVASALANVPLSTGLLPPHTLCYARTGGQIAIAVLIPAATHTVQVETPDGITPLTIPLPPFVFAGHGHQYFIFALKDTIPGSTTPLFAAPCSNVFQQGNICQGNTPFPQTAPDTIYAAFRAFLHTSTFNTHLADQRILGKDAANVLNLWQDLHRRKRQRFPVRTLLPVGLTLGGLIQQLSHLSR